MAVRNNTKLRRNGLRIDGDKLRTIIKYLGTTNAEVSRAIGYSSSAVGDWTREKGYGCWMPKPAILAFEQVYGVKYDDYKYEESVKPENIEEQKQEVAPIVTLDMDELHKVIYSAVYEAVKQAWNEPCA